MSKRKLIMQAAIAGGLLLGIAGVGVGCVHVWQSAHQARLDEAYVMLLPAPTLAVTHRHYEVRGAFTDTVERFRFEGGTPTLVQAIAERHGLQPAEQPLESKFSAPGWWVLPQMPTYYLRGTGHEYMLLIFDPASGQVLVERTQD